MAVLAAAAGCDAGSARLSAAPVAPLAVGSESDSALAPNAVVVSVIDGDTIRVDIDGRRELVRLLGIDTPEKTGGYLAPECGGDLAHSYVFGRLPPGTEVHLKRDVELRDRYDRLLAYVYLAGEGTLINQELVLNGYAGTMHFEPNVALRNELDAAQAEARSNNRNIWASCGGFDQPLS